MSHGTLVVPSWVPRSVQAIGAVVPCVEEIRLRLLTDVRMEAVWRELAQNPVNANRLETVYEWRRLKAWGLDYCGESNSNAASAAIFAFAAVNLSNDQAVWTSRLKKGSCDDFKKASALCEAFSSDHMMTSPEERAALQASSTFFRNMESLVANLKGPCVLGKDAKERGDVQIRVHARDLAQEVQRMFGTFLCGTVATLVNVGLHPRKEITLKNVTYWCSDLRV